MPNIPRDIISTINAQPRGDYQRGLLDGAENWSGSSLRGAAQQWGAKYARSRLGLIDRINRALPNDWRAEDALVFDVDNRRWCRELVVIGPDGAWAWTDGLRLTRVEFDKYVPADAVDDPYCRELLAE